MNTTQPVYNIEAIRDLLTAMFDGPSLDVLCTDVPDFIPIRTLWPLAGSVADRIQTLITYCEQQGLMEELLARAEQRNPQRYKQYAEKIRRPEQRDRPRGRGKGTVGGLGPGAIHQAPRPLADFVGRQKEIRQLVKALQPGARAAITGIVGMGGLGKTELAKVVAREVAERFPDGVLWANCGQQELVAVADLWAATYGLQLVGDDLPAKAARWRGLVSGKQALLIFDNVQPEQAVQELFPPLGQSAVLVTSREVDHPALHGASQLKLDQFTPAEAMALARGVLGREAGQRQAAEAEQLFGLVGYLPLAVAVALQSARECGWKLAYLNEKLAAAGALDVLGDEKLLGQSLRATFEMAWESLSEDLRDTFRTLALFNEGPSFSTVAVAETLNLAEPEAGARLRRLARRSLLTDMGDDRWALHPLLRQFATTRPTVDRAVWVRMARHYTLVAGVADALYLQGGEQVTHGLTLFDLEWPHIRAGQGWSAAHADDDDEAARLCSEYADYGIYCLNLRLHPLERIRWLEPGARAAHIEEDRAAESAHLSNLGLAYAALGESRRAIGYYEQALAIAREIGDRPGEGAVLGNLGNAYAVLGEARRAIGYYEARLNIAREIGDRRGEGAALGNLGNAYADLSEVRRAIDYYEQQLVITREIGDRRGEGAALGNLGKAYADLGAALRAIEYYEQRLEIAREIGDRRGEGKGLNNLGMAYAGLGEVRRAIGYYEQALAIDREMGDRLGEGNALGNLGLAYARLGEVRRAIEYYEQQLVITREIGDRQGEGNALGNLGNAYAALGEVRRAVEYYEQQLVITREIGDRRGEGNALGNLGIAYKNLGEVRRAIEYYEQQLVITREIGNRQGEGAALGNLGTAYTRLGEVRRAIGYYEQQLAITREIGDRQGEGNALGNLGLAHAVLGDTRRAIWHYEARLNIAREIGDRRGEGNALGNLGLAYAALGEVRRAIEYYEQRLEIAREIGDRRGEGNALNNLGMAYAGLGEVRRAIGYYEAWLGIAREIGDRRGEGVDLGNLGLAYARLGEEQRARELWTEALHIFEAIEDPKAERVRDWLAGLDG